MTTTEVESSQIDTRIERLSSVSLRRVIEPDDEFDWGSLGDGQVIADDLLSIVDLDITLTTEQRALLSREEVAAMLQAGIQFEAVLNAALAMLIVERYALRDPRVTYILHEIGEETRHSRAFIRLVDRLAPTTVNPLERGIPVWVRGRVIRSLFNNPALLMVFVLAGEEIPDMLQRLASEHPNTDPLLAQVNRYHRQEEARHLTFARTVLPEWWARADRTERLRVHHLAPLVIQALWQEMVHPGVYAAVGLPRFKTWFRANKSATRVALRYEGTRPILAVLLDTGVIRRGQVPKAWRMLCHVDRDGEPLPV